MALSGALIEDTGGLEAVRAEWDALAVAASRPYCAPAWMLAWWRHVGSSQGRLRTVAVRDGRGRLVALAPLYAEGAAARPARYRLLAADLSHRVEPLAPGMEAEAAAVIAVTLAQAQPRPALISFENIDGESTWPALLADAWPGAGSASLRQVWSGPALTIRLEGSSFDDWLMRRSRKFRGYSRRNRKQIEEQGGEFRLAGTEEELERDLGEFARLHYQRWAGRGGSVALTEAVERMLAEAGLGLMRAGRFRLFSIDIDGQAISSNLFVAAGDDVAYWNGGFDPAFAELQPSLRGVEAAIRDGIERGERRLDLGGGDEPYKHRIADDEGTLKSVQLLPPGPGRTLTRLQLAPRALARTARRRLRRA